MIQDWERNPTDMAVENNRPDRPKRRGPTKTPATIRFDTDVLSALKATGPGWQTRVNQIVRQWVLNERGPQNE